MIHVARMIKTIVQRMPLAQATKVFTRANAKTGTVMFPPTNIIRVEIVVVRIPNLRRLRLNAIRKKKTRVQLGKSAWIQIRTTCANVHGVLFVRVTTNA